MSVKLKLRVIPRVGENSYVILFEISQPGIWTDFDNYIAKFHHQKLPIIKIFRIRDEKEFVAGYQLDSTANPKNVFLQARDQFRSKNQEPVDYELSIENYTDEPKIEFFEAVEDAR